jgi:F-type H+-transporting ATPase subunit b
MINLNYTIIIQLAIVLGLMVILSKIVFNPFLAVLQKRKDQIDGAEKKALELQERANDLLERYREAMAAAQAQGATILEGIRKESLAKESEILKKSMEDSNQMIRQIQQRISAEIEEARTDLQMKTQTLSREIAEKVLGRSLL